MLDRAEACNMGQALLQKKFMVSVGGSGQEDGCFGEGKETMDTLYRLLEDDLHSPLNGGQTATYTPKQGRSGEDQDPGIHTLLSQLVQIQITNSQLSLMLVFCCWLRCVILLGSFRFVCYASDVWDGES